MIRYPVLLAARSRAALAPAAAWLFVLAGVYAYRPNDVGGSFAVTAALLVPLAAWLAVALSHAEPAPQRELLAADRDPVAALVRTAGAVALLAVAAGVIDVAWPVVTGAFERDPGAGDIVGAAIAHTGCAVYGALLGTVVSARFVARPGVAFAGLAAFAIAAVPLFELAPALSPAAWTADALLDERALAAPCRRPRRPRRRRARPRGLGAAADGMTTGQAAGPSCGNPHPRTHGGLAVAGPGAGTLLTCPLESQPWSPPVSPVCSHSA